MPLLFHGSFYANTSECFFMYALPVFLPSAPVESAFWSVNRDCRLHKWTYIQFRVNVELLLAQVCCFYLYTLRSTEEERRCLSYVVCFRDRFLMHKHFTESSRIRSLSQEHREQVSKEARRTVCSHDGRVFWNALLYVLRLFSVMNQLIMQIYDPFLA